MRDAHAARASSLFAETAASALRITSGRRPGRVASTVRICRQRRAPGRPWNSPIMWRVTAASRPPAAQCALGIGDHALRRGHRIGRLAAAPSIAIDAGEHRRVLVGGAAEHDAVDMRSRCVARRVEVGDAAVDADEHVRQPLPSADRRGHSRAAGCRGSPSATGPAARPCAHAPRSRRRRPRARRRRARSSASSGSCSSTPMRHFTVTGTRDRRLHRRDAVADQLRLAHQAGAERARLHAVGRAADIEVDLVIAEVRADPRRLGELRRIGAAELQRHRMLDRIEAEQPLAVAVDHRIGRHHLGVEQRAARQPRGGRTGNAGPSSPSSARRRRSFRAAAWRLARLCGGFRQGRSLQASIRARAGFPVLKPVGGRLRMLHDEPGNREDAAWVGRAARLGFAPALCLSGLQIHDPARAEAASGASQADAVGADRAGLRTLPPARPKGRVEKRQATPRPTRPFRDDAPKNAGQRAGRARSKGACRRRAKPKPH